MEYRKLSNRYTNISLMIHYLEKQQRRGDTDISVAQEIDQLRQEQKKVACELDEYNARYKAWRCD